ncbi:transcriptional regulator, LacI family [Paracidovorax avenae ATCC 19860]|uniref:Transcriptional regulator, LacI family n=1 Tax=Paracidovorax avenae (strain ATCC 19860 / DSM 7227 / CCUG 15838 / JCM 20985 / LMG 2117 / NCPPB 1011) TaxID=643561 RepID=F0QB40_PARA1|nr:LacI family DNA-binding transcriptional regulator [Paracidovorax avenae]ADX48535.1 transcriptional regulator, LacI family [Paracidovorax avenae ATCC 19860]
MQGDKPRKGAQARVPTLDEVARLAGVSTSAVSRAYTPGASVSEKTREKVMAAASALGYRPNLLARSLSTGRTRTVGIAVTRLENSFHAELLSHLSRGLREAGFGVRLFVSAGDEDAGPGIGEVLRYRVDALVLCAIGLSSRMENECAAAGVPVVLVNRTTVAPMTACVTGANRQGGETVAAFLLAAGHRRFGFIAGTEGASTSGERFEGYRHVLAEAGVRPPVVVGAAFDADRAADAARRMLSAPNAPDAVFCANDHMAIAVQMVAMRELGRVPGQDLSVVGFDDTLAARMVGLTTFSQSAAGLAAVAIAMVSDPIEDGLSGVRRVVEGELVVRGSARLPAEGLRTAAGRTIWTPTQRP